MYNVLKSTPKIRRFFGWLPVLPHHEISGKSWQNASFSVARWKVNQKKWVEMLRMKRNCNRSPRFHRCNGREFVRDELPAVWGVVKTIGNSWGMIVKGIVSCFLLSMSNSLCFFVFRVKWFVEDLLDPCFFSVVPVLGMSWAIVPGTLWDLVDAHLILLKGFDSTHGEVGIWKICV